MSSLFKYIATLGPIGYLPAPGTCGSVLALGVLYVLHAANISRVWYAVFLIVCTIFAWYAVVQALDTFKHKDPSQIVIDEVVGCMVTFFMVPLSYKTIIIGFLLFRLFDISKTFGVQKLELMGGAWGILLDDIGAGIISNVMLHILICF